MRLTDYNKEKGVNGVANSYVHAVKGRPQSVNMEIESTLMLVLDDECLNSKDLSNSLLGRVKEFASLSNLKMVLTNEGFDNIKIKYMGKFWVLLEFASEVSKNLFQSNMGVGSWFTQLIQASMNFSIDGRVAWVEIEGIPFKMWSVNTFQRIASKWGVLLHIDDHEDDCFHTKRMCINTKVGMNILESFKIIYRIKVFWIRAKEVPGWVPDFMEETDEDYDSDDGSKEGGLKVEDVAILGGKSDVEEVLETEFEERLLNHNLEEASTGQKDKHSEDPFNMYPLINKKSNVVDRGNNCDHSLKYPPGYMTTGDKEEHCKKDEESKKESGDYSQGHHEEELNTGIKDKCSNKGSKEDVAESVCLGHFKKSETPRTGGFILNLMDELVKVGQTMEYNMEGCLAQKAKKDWVKELCVNNKSASVGEVVIMGDFNEVHNKTKRFGLIFNVQGANVFNMFIANAGLEEVPLGGSSFTWCHKSASKISKLDRFLISESLMSSCSNISAITLERYLSDHRPILLHETHFDYGPTPFRFFHYWFEMEGFDKLVEDTWIKALVDESNVMTNMMMKLKYLKQKIREWNKGKMKSAKNRKIRFKEELAALDVIIDKGEGNAEVVKQRTDVIKSLQDMENLQSLETAQKAKIKWAIEGDKNSRYYHGVLNKKRNQLNIRGILVDGIWTDNLCRVKREFLQHLKKRFDKPDDNRIHLDMNYSKILSSDQQVELELEVSKEEIKRAVWDRGTDKSPSPDGFTFVFYRCFWKVIEDDVVDAVTYFFTHGSSLKWSDANFNTIVHVLECFFRSKIGGLMSRVQSWNEVVDRVIARLSKWKMKTLSIGGRLTLLKSVLGSMPIYHMSIFKVPMCVLHMLESIRSYFFSGHDLNSKKTSWVKWKNVLASKEKGGLGVSSLYALNRGLMFKWVWWFFTQNTSLWTRVIKAIHGEDGKVGKNVKSGFPSIWLDIVHEMDVLKKQDIDIINYLYPGGVEQEQYIALIDQVHDVSFIPMRARQIWSLESLGEFSVASVRKLIDDKMLPDVANKTRWIKNVPIKVNVLAWKVRLDSLPKRLNISRRGIDINSIKCLICDNEVESTSHLFFTCHIASEIFRKISC
ncbi:RNA-directed DNA polymerase, eukaryota, reverse transcriptase zinc-binding domain protein [Tanacetum coccineum]